MESNVSNFVTRRNWHYLLTYLLTPWRRVFLENQTGFQLVKKFSAFFWEPKFHYYIHNSQPPVPILSQINPVHDPSSHFLMIHLILSSHLRLGLPSGHLPSSFPTKTLHAPLLSPISATCPAHLIILNVITRIMLGKEYRSLSYSSCSFPHSPVTSSLLGPNILLSTLFSNTLSLRSFLNVSD